MGWPRSVITLTAERVGSAGTVPDFLEKSANRPHAPLIAMLLIAMLRPVVTEP
jgi:hypothetical protein